MSDLKTFPSIRAMARHIGISETALRKRMKRFGESGLVQGMRGRAVPLILSDMPETLEERLADIDRRLVAVLVRLDGIQSTVRAIAAKLDDEPL